MRRTLQLCGISDRAGRDQLDEVAHGLPLGGGLAADAVEVRGARNDDGVLAVTVRADGVSPAELFNAVLRHGNDEITLLVDAMDDVIPAARSTLLTGGWAGMKSVQRARARCFPRSGCPTVARTPPTERPSSPPGCFRTGRGPRRRCDGRLRTAPASDPMNRPSRDDTALTEETTPSDVARPPMEEHLHE